MSRRKPALRIGGGVMNRNSLYQKDDAKSGGLGLLGTYQDSDSEDNTASASNQLTKAINNLDSKVADFLKEIDELEGTDTKKEEQKSEPREISYGNWQQCIDENTQHPYYWNTATDEVTWVLPEEIARQLEQVEKFTEVRPSATEEVSSNASEVVKSDEKCIEKDQKEDTEVHKHTEIETMNEESFDIDVDAELDQALENTESRGSEHTAAESFEAPTQLDLELEVLRRGDLPLSDGEEEDLLIRFEADILKLEEGEEEKRKNGTWKIYEGEIEKRKQEINLDKTKWREERLPELKRMRIDGVPDAQEGHETDLFQTDGGNSEKEKSLEKKDNVDEKEESHNKKTDTSQKQSHDDMDSREPVLSDVQEESVSENLQDEMSTLSSTIIDKLEFIGVSKRDFTNFHRLLIEIETRVADCKEGFLPASYVVSKLQAATRQLKAYEDTATPEGWSCHWDRTAKRYFYMNNETKKMQWQYPEVKKAPDKSEADDKDRVTDTKEANSGESNQNKRTIVESTAQNGEASHGKKMRSEDGQAIDVKIDSKNAAENSNNTQCAYPYGSFYQQSMCSSTPPPPGEDEQDAQPPLPSAPAEVPPPPPPEEDVEGDVDTKMEDDGIMMEMSEDEDEDKKVDAVNTAIISQPILYKPSDMPQFQAPMMNYAMYAAASTAYQEASSPLMQTVQQSFTASGRTSTAKQTKLKKTKKSKKSAVVKKPAKGMTSLVAQWQKAKNQIEEEDRLLEQDDDVEVDQETLTKQQIEKWKTDQIMSGKALTNSNFEPIPEDWRNRILKKKKAKG